MAETLIILTQDDAEIVSHIEKLTIDNRSKTMSIMFRVDADDVEELRKGNEATIIFEHDLYRTIFDVEIKRRTTRRVEVSIGYKKFMATIHVEPREDGSWGEIESKSWELE